MISNKDLRVEGGKLIINGEKHPLDPAVEALTKRANTVQGKLSALGTKITAIEALEKTASGNPISLTGAAAAYAMTNIMTIEPIQSGSGDPSPTNVRPISGLTEGVVTRTGKNLLPVTLDGIKTANTSGTWSGNTYTLNGMTFTVNADSDGNVISIVVSGKSNSSIDFYFYKEQIVISNNSILSTEVTRAVGFDEYIGTMGITTGYDSVSIPSGNYTNCGLYIVANTAMNNLTFKPMIRFATETDSTFEPYTSATATITFGQTVYGGSVNFKTGEVTVTHGFITFDGSEPWYTNGDRGVYLNCVDISPNIKAKGELKFSDYVVIDSGDAPTSNGYANFNVSGLAIQVHDENGMTASNYKTYLASHNIQLCYELATPTTLTLTPAELELLKGANTISGNGANINISYIGR